MRLFPYAKNLKFYLVLFILSVVFISIFSISTSPLMSDKTGGVDSEIFMIIGKNWAAGNMPYITAWDHKGPLIFFINAVGYLLTGNDFGIYLLQIISLYFTLLLTFKSFNLFLTPNRSFLFTAIILLALSINYESGNLTEEYLLPLMAGFFYALLKYLYSRNRNNSLLVLAFLGGTILAFSFLTRLTNALGVCLGCFVIFIHLVCGKEYKLAKKAVYMFWGGCALLTLPFIIYFHVHGALDEMWYATITYNVKNSQVAGGKVFESPFFILFLFLKFIHCFFLLIPVALLFKNRNYWYACIWLVFAISPLLWIIPSPLFPHYGMTVLSLSAMAIILLINLQKDNYKSSLKPVIKYIIAAFGAYSLLSAVMILPMQIKHMTGTPHSYGVVDQWFEMYNIDKNSFLVYNYDWSIYLNKDITPSMRFFLGHDELIRFDEFEEMVYKSFDSAHVKWLVVGEPIQHNKIKEFVETNYELIASGQNCTLYKLNQMPSLPPATIDIN